MKGIRNWTVVVLATLSLSALAQGPIRLIFSNTDVADVLRAISLKSGASIVYSAQESIPISISATARNAEEAVRAVSAAAGLMYKKVAGVYVVANAANMRHALEPYGQKAYLTVSGPAPSDSAKQLEDMLPWLTARAAGTQVLVIGDPLDIEEARRQVPGIEARYRMNMRINEVVFLRYATASQVVGMLKNMFPGVSADAFGPTDKPGGGIGLSGPRAEVDAAKEMIRSVDQPMAAMLPDMEFRVYHIRYSSAPVLKAFLDSANIDVLCVMGPESYSPPMPGFRPISGASLSSSNSNGSNSNGGGANGGQGGSGVSGGTSGAGGGMQGYQRPHKDGDEVKTLVLRGTPVQIDRAFALLEAVDLKPMQVMVEVKVVDASPEKAEELGVKWDWTKFGFYELPPGSDTTGSGPTTTRNGGLGMFSRLPWNINAILSAMITSKDAKLLASPKVQVTDNDEASIFIGTTIRARLSQAGIAGTTIDIREFPVGIILLMRPRLNADGNITMRVHPVVSSITSVSADNIPQTASREAETTVIVKDGETMVIGGLISEEMTRTIQEVPLLSQIPLLGELFRHRSTNKRNSEVMIFITPHIVKDGAGTAPQKTEPKKEGGK